ncbi:MAG: hypothetical protein U5O39_11055 [Gammaproteobacteria bacterium]|nr:hypothetical protein [Gammaproteobacteria bacterium]
MWRPALFALLAFELFSPRMASAEIYGSGWYREVQLSVGHESNVPRSYKPTDETKDTMVSAQAGLGYSQKAGDHLQYVVTGYVDHTAHETFDALDHTTLSVSGRLIWQPKVDYNAIWYESRAEVTRFEYRRSDPREGYLLTGDASLNRRLGLRWIGHLGYRYLDFVLDKDDVQANRDAAFDIARHEIYAGLEYQLSRRVWLSGTWGFQHGGFTASSSISPGEIQYDADTKDWAFESCSIIRCVPFYAYRSITDIHTVDLAVVFPVANLDADLSVRYFDASSDNDLEYDDWLVQLGVIWTFQ